MNRRSFLSSSVATGVVGGAIIASAATIARAGEAAKSAPAAVSKKDITTAAQNCLTAAYACRELCVSTLQKGDTMMAACIRKVEDMMPLCDAVAVLSASNSKHLKKLAAVCIDSCTECETECKKHAGHMPECKACAEACAACITACKTA